MNGVSHLNETTGVDVQEVAEDVNFVDSLIAQQERSDLEFKAATNNFSTEKILSYCAAIANDGGGRLVLGVGDSMPRAVVGSSVVPNPQSMENHVHEKLGISVVIRIAMYGDKRVVVFQIPPRRRGAPIDYDGRYLTRVGESLVSMTPHQIGAVLDEASEPLVSRILQDGLTPGAVSDLLDLDAYFRLLRENRPPGLEAQLALLARRGLIRINVTGASYAVTILGALFLSRDLTQFPSLQWRRIRFLKYAGNDRVHATFEKFENRGYGVAFEDVLDLIGSNVPMREVIEGGIRETSPVYPPTAIREFLANALVHQDLDESGVQITIEIFKDRLEIRNPGTPLIEVTRFVDETRSRNFELSEIMRLAGICEVRGSGIDRALEQIEDLLRPAPIFKAETAATAVILHADQPFESMTLDERMWGTFLHCCVKYAGGDRLTNTTLRERFGLPASKTTLASQTIAAAVEAGLLRIDPRVGSSKRHARYMPFFGT